ncbi:hypothetical protein D3C76_1539550 [compost metagenome]
MVLLVHQESISRYNRNPLGCCSLGIIKHWHMRWQITPEEQSPVRLGIGNGLTHMLLQLVHHQCCFSPIYLTDAVNVPCVVILCHELVCQNLWKHSRMYVFSLFRDNHLLHDFMWCLYKTNTQSRRQNFRE